jgi:capsular polysaccharide biosynthesis protein
MKEKIYIKEFIQLLTRYLKPMGIIVGITLLCFINLSFILPKSYKSEFELNIYPKYFYNALISDIVPGINSSPEMTQTVAAMVKEVMNDNFVDNIGNIYKIYKKDMTQYELSRARADLRERFELFSSGGNTYHIAFIYNDPAITLAVTNDVMEAVRRHFINTRLSTIEFAQQTIVKKLDSANATKEFTESDTNTQLTTKDPSIVVAELSKIDQEIGSLKSRFNARHPRVVKLQEKKNTLETYLKEIGGAKIIDDEDEDEKADGKNYAPVLMSNDKETSKSITSKLYSNFNNINMALDIERESISSYIAVTEAPQFPTSPLFPKKRLFASLGLILGLVFSFLYILFKEVIYSAPTEKAKETAQNFRGNFFGRLPEISESDLMSNGIMLIEDGSAKFKLEYSTSGND